MAMTLLRLLLSVLLFLVDQDEILAASVSVWLCAFVMVEVGGSPIEIEYVEQH
jgi:hypothetical protein